MKPKVKSFWTKSCKKCQVKSKMWSEDRGNLNLVIQWSTSVASTTLSLKMWSEVRGNLNLAIQWSKSVASTTLSLIKFCCIKSSCVELRWVAMSHVELSWVEPIQVKLKEESKEWLKIFYLDSINLVLHHDLHVCGHCLDHLKPVDFHDISALGVESLKIKTVTSRLALLEHLSTF